MELLLLVIDVVQSFDYLLKCLVLNRYRLQLLMVLMISNAEHDIKISDLFELCNNRVVLCCDVHVYDI